MSEPGTAGQADEETPDEQARSRGTMVVLQPMEQAAGGYLRRLLETAINGLGTLPSARQAAARNLGKRGDHDAAIESIIRTHVTMAGAQGFATNLGGLAISAIALPVNITGVALIQLRMVAAIAHLRGYDLDDPRTRSAVLLCLLGEDPVVASLTREGLPSSPLVVATAPVFDPVLDRRISELVMGELASNVTGRHAAALVGRRIPGLGGGVGATLDGWSTYQLGRWAKQQLVSRRGR